MQIISSLFNLQSGRIKDKQALEIFKSSQNRVRSMALIHERLYKSKDLARVNFAEYTQSLATHLFSSYGINTNVIKFYINIKDVFLDINTAIPCGLIINELVSNSLKHAFPGEKNGEIKIAGHPLNKNEIELIVSDNGVGLPKKVDFRKTDSLGLHLVKLLAEDQLHGDIKLDRTKGTSFHIKFKVKR
jgi:two-component sensor histidine kinase